MLPRIALLIFFALPLQHGVFANSRAAAQDSITVYVFLHESCRISQYYTLQLRALSEEFTGQHLQFIGLFPNRSSKPENMQQFKEEYKIPFALKTDYDKRLTEQLGATVTPEVVVYNETQKSILYKGRIDNAYARVGKRRLVTSTSELKDALSAIVAGVPVSVTTTPAVGCFINTGDTK